MARRNNHHVLIAGAGPVGLAAALFLHERGVDVEIVDGAWAPRRDDFAVVLHPDTLARLDDVGLDLDLAREAIAIDTIAIYERGRRRVAADLAAPPPAFGFAAIVPLRLLRDKLEVRLRERGVRVQWHHRLGRVDAEAGRLTAVVEVLDREPTGYAVAEIDGIVGRTVRHEPWYLIGADGRDSLVRGQLRTPWRAIGGPDVIAAFEVDGGPTLGGEIRLSVGDAVCALWPLPAGGTRLAFVLPRSTAPIAARLSAGEAPDAADLAALIDTYLPGLDAPIGRVRWSHLEAARSGLAERPAVPGVWLLGEAAHELPPVASHTLNQGLRAAHDLASTLGRVLRDHASPELLDRHGAAAASAAEHVARIADAFVPDDDAAPVVAAAAGRLLPMIPAAGGDLDHVARQLGLGPAGASLPLPPRPEVERVVPRRI